MTTSSSIRYNLFPCAGLLVPALVWAANTQAGQILPSVECGGFKYAAVSSFAAAALSLAAGFLSWRTVGRNGSDAALRAVGFPESFRFVGMLSALNGVLFAFALVLQGASSLMLTGCEH